MARQIWPVNITHLKGIQGAVDFPRGAQPISAVSLAQGLTLYCEIDSEGFTQKETRFVTVVRESGALIANRGRFVGTVVEEPSSVWHVYVG